MTDCITLSTYCSLHCSLTHIVFINVFQFVMDDDYNVMQNWINVAEWREKKREEEEEKRKMFVGCQNVRLSGAHKNRQFFNIDARNEYRRQEQERIKKEKRDFFNIDGRKEYRRQEEERIKMEEEEEEEKRKKKEEEQRKEEEEEHQEESQSLFGMHQAMTKAENCRRKYDNFAKLFKKHS